MFHATNFVGVVHCCYWVNRWHANYLCNINDFQHTHLTIFEVHLLGTLVMLLLKMSLWTCMTQFLFVLSSRHLAFNSMVSAEFLKLNIWPKRPRICRLCRAGVYGWVCAALLLVCHRLWFCLSRMHCQQKGQSQGKNISKPENHLVIFFAAI